MASWTAIGAAGWRSRLGSTRVSGCGSPDSLKPEPVPEDASSLNADDRGNVDGGGGLRPRPRWPRPDRRPPRGGGPVLGLSDGSVPVLGSASAAMLLSGCLERPQLQSELCARYFNGRTTAIPPN